MSANQQESTQKHKIHPNSLANLKPVLWEPGKSANPGGIPKGTVHADAAYQRLGKLKLADLEALEVDNAVEGAIRRSIIAANKADDWQEANAALKQLILCLDGSPLKRQQVEINLTVENKQEITINAYALIFLEKSDDDIRAEAEALIDARHAEQPFDALCTLLAPVIEADAVAYEQVREQAEALVLGANR